MVCGRAGTELGRIVVDSGPHRSEVRPDGDGWFSVVVEGTDGVTLSGVDEGGEAVTDLDGLPIALPLEQLR